MKKGFTLIEVLGVIVVLGIIALITVPVIDNLIKDSREKAYQQNKDYILHTALQYSSEYDLGYSSDEKTLALQTLKNAGLLEDKDIRNPINDTVMRGCVKYRWKDATNQYEFRYEENSTLCD